MTVQNVGVRLAIRKEGAWVRAYLASEGTMDGARELGAILVTIADQDENIWTRWKLLMMDAVSAIIGRVFDQVPEWTERPAPEHERSGRA